MSVNLKPEVPLLEQLASIRQALQEERESLLARVQTIDAALAITPTSKAPQKAAKAPRETKASGGIKEAVLVAVTGTQGLTIKEIQALVTEGNPKSVESVVHTMASAGQLTKDGSTPRKFCLPETKPTKSNGSAKSATA